MHIGTIDNVGAVRDNFSSNNSSGLVRDIRLLELIASDQSNQKGGLGVSELAVLTGRSKSVISRALSTLANAGLVTRDPATQAYRIGSRLFAISARSTDAHLVHAGRPILMDLVRRTGETAHLCVLSHGNELTLASELSPHELRSAGWQGVTTAAWRTSSGRVLLSELTDEALLNWFEQHGSDRAVVQADLFDREPNPFRLLEKPKNRVVDFDSFLHELRLIRSQGFALLDEELELGVVGVSAPVYDNTKRLIAAINVSGPKSRLQGNLEHLTLMVRRSAQSLSIALGSAAARK